MLSNAAFCAPARTTLRETESGAHYEAEEGPRSVAPAKLCSGAGRGSPHYGCAVQRSPPRSHVPSSTLRRARRRCRILPQPAWDGGRDTVSEAWGAGAAAIAPRFTMSLAAACAPSRTTLRESESGRLSGRSALSLGLSRVVALAAPRFACALADRRASERA